MDFPGTVPVRPQAQVLHDCRILPVIAADIYGALTAYRSPFKGPHPEGFNPPILATPGRVMIYDCCVHFTDGEAEVWGS